MNFKKKYDLEVNFLHCFQLLAAIPSDLKKKAFDSPTPDLFSTSLEYHQLEDGTLILPKLRCKNYYKLFIEKLAVEPTAFKSWKRYFPELTIWNKCFVEIYKSSKNNKLRQFSFKVLHRIIPSKKELKKYNLINDDTCSLCPNSDSIEHTYIHCIESTNFFTKTMRWFNDFHNTNGYNSPTYKFYSTLSKAPFFHNYRIPIKADYRY